MSVWRRWWTLTATERQLVTEAAILVLGIRTGLHVMAFPTLRRRLDACAPAPPQSVADIARAVSAAGRHLPGTTCLPEALAAYTMLRRRGHAPVFRLGVRDGGASVVDAHAWVECDGAVVVGSMDARAGYAVLS